MGPIGCCPGPMPSSGKRLLFSCPRKPSFCARSALCFSVSFSSGTWVPETFRENDMISLRIRYADYNHTNSLKNPPAFIKVATYLTKRGCLTMVHQDWRLALPPRPALPRGRRTPRPLARRSRRPARRWSMPTHARPCPRTRRRSAAPAAWVAGWPTPMRRTHLSI